MSYDDIPYESGVFRQTHPDHLYLCGKLLGLSPPDFRTASVLEIGCGEGLNLLSAAIAFPEASFTGIDLSERHINTAQRLKNALYLDNIVFQHRDLAQLSKNDGRFDYIICHGVYSWVTDKLRRKILKTCRENLDPQGLALISYNAFPGWHFESSLRNMALYHTRKAAGPKEKLAQARAFMDFLAAHTPESPKNYRDFLKAQRDALNALPDGYFYHDFLEENNKPFYLHQFADDLATQKLSYVGDAQISSMFAGNLGEQATQALAPFKDHIEHEQYTDFLKNRPFRMSLVGHASVRPHRNIDPDAIFDWHLTSNVVQVPPPPGGEPFPAFQSRNGTGYFQVKNPHAAHFYEALTERGLMPVRAATLVREIVEKSGAPETGLYDIIRQLGLHAYLHGFIGLHACPENFLPHVADRPKAFPLAREQALADIHTAQIVSAARVTLKSGPFTNLLLRYMDGTHDANELVQLMTGHAIAGAFTLNGGKGPLTEPEAIERALTELVAQALAHMAKTGLLVL